jgi:predicted DNA-binding ribbon-helix-helix protein
MSLHETTHVTVWQLVDKILERMIEKDHPRASAFHVQCQVWIERKNALQDHGIMFNHLDCNALVGLQILGSLLQDWAQHSIGCIRFLCP